MGVENFLPKRFSRSAIGVSRCGDEVVGAVVVVVAARVRLVLVGERFWLEPLHLPERELFT